MRKVLISLPDPDLGSLEAEQALTALNATVIFFKRYSEWKKCDSVFYPDSLEKGSFAILMVETGFKSVFDSIPKDATILNEILKSAPEDVEKAFRNAKKATKELGGINVRYPDSPGIEWNVFQDQNNIVTYSRKSIFFDTVFGFVSSHNFKTDSVTVNSASHDGKNFTASFGNRKSFLQFNEDITSFLKKHLDIQSASVIFEGEATYSEKNFIATLTQIKVEKYEILENFTKSEELMKHLNDHMNILDEKDVEEVFASIRGII